MATNILNLLRQLPNDYRTSDLSLENSWQPYINVVENDNYIFVDVELAGIEPDNINIDFFNNQIEVKGRRQHIYTDEIIHKNELLYGEFRRLINIPISVTNKESVKTSLQNGILHITIDKDVENRNRFSVSVE